MYKSRADLDGDTNPDKGLAVETGHQLVEARRAVQTLVSSGVMGDETHDFVIVLSGNANPAHEATPDGTKEWMSITITQK